MHAAAAAAALFWLLSTAHPTARAQAPGSQPLLVVFGDSLSDTGNRFLLSNSSEPPEQFYFQGRFSNGPVWVDDIANSSVAGSWQVLNYAVGGARACDYRPIPGATPTPAIGPGKISPPLNSVQILNLTQQVDLYLSGFLPPSLANYTSNSTVNSTFATVFPPGTTASAIMVMIGGNDFLGELLDATFSRENITQSLIGLPEHMVGCTIANLERLLNASTAISTTGTIIVSTLPPIQSVPLVRKPATEGLDKDIANAVQYHRTLLTARVQQLQQQYALQRHQQQQTETQLLLQPGGGPPVSSSAGPSAPVPASAASGPQMVMFDMYNYTQALLANASESLHIGDTENACVNYGVLSTALTLGVQANPQVTQNGSIISRAIGLAADLLQAGADVLGRIAEALGIDGVNSDQLRQASQQAGPAIQSGGALYPAQNVSVTGAGGQQGARDRGLIRRVISSAFDKVTSECDNPEDHFFWDGIHPTTKVHQRLAQLVAPYLPQA